MKNKEYMLIGERAAMGGYLPQYDEFAIGVYDAITSGDLEEIRVADIEENVGKLDDVVYVTTQEVYAYQVKWTTTDDKMSYLDFKALIPEIVEGWRKLKRLYPDKTVKPRLLTNKQLTDGDYSIKHLAGKDAGGFVAYERDVIRQLCAGGQINSRWDYAVEELRHEVQLEDKEWYAFWKEFVFTFGYQQEIIEVSKTAVDQRTSAIIHINRMIQEMAARKEFTLTLREILVRLGWQNLFQTIFDHNLVVPAESYVPNASGITQLNSCLDGKTKGYLFLKGTPGSGKSTLLTQWLRSLKNPSVRFYAFDFLNPSSQKNNDSSRGSGTTFLNDIVVQIHKSGIEEGRILPPLRDIALLKTRFYSQLDAISKNYESTKIPFLIVVDGLDHITREYQLSEQTLMEVLPSPSDIPEGVIFVLGSQRFDHLNLNRFILKESESKENLVIMPPLSKKEVGALCMKLLDKCLITEDVLNKCWSKSQGHPLYLRYLLNQIAEVGVDILETMEDAPEDVNDYYSRIVGSLLESPTLQNTMGLLARIAGVIRIDDIRGMCSDDSIRDIKKNMWHLFRYDKAGQELSFFHNSFRQYLLNKTAEDILTGEYRKEMDVKYYCQLSDYFKGAWEYGYYLYKAEKFEEFITELTPENLFVQAQDYRPLWSIQRDLVNGVEIARQRRDPYLLVRYLLLENQISQMDNQDYGVLSLVEEFIHTGRGKIAKAIIREGRELHCASEYALELAVEFLKTGDREEANLLFELSYPVYLSTKPTGRHHFHLDPREKYRSLKIWVKTAGYFVDWPDIERNIAVFLDYLNSISGNDHRLDVKQAELGFVCEYLDSLVDQERWEDLEESVKRFSNDEKYKNAIFHAYDEAIVSLGKVNPHHKKLHYFFSEAEKCLGRKLLSGKIYLRMAYLAYMSNQCDSVIESYIRKVDWTDLGSYYQNDVQQKFESLSPFIFYVKIRAKFGLRDEMTWLVPDDKTHQDNEMMVGYARRVFCIAQMTGRALAGVKDASFLQLATFCIKFYDTIVSPVPYHRYKYVLSQQRGDFYQYVVECAKVYGHDMLIKIAKVFEIFFAEPSCRADSESRRDAIKALYNAGYDVDWCRVQLEKIDETMMEWKDVDGRERECLLQGQTWLAFGDLDRAECLFHQMVKESFGVGYRKDYQPSVFAEWIGEAIKTDSGHAIGYIHWLTSRFKHIETISETRTRQRSAQTLLIKTLAFNLRSGLKLGIWLLDHEYDFFQSVNSVMLEAMLEKAQNELEYSLLLRYYTDIYLYTDDNDTSVLNTGLLKRVVRCGQRILGKAFKPYESILRSKIYTECPESITEALTKALDDLVTPIVDKPKTESSRAENQKLVEAQKLLDDGKTKEAWEMAVSVLEDSSSSGCDRFYDGGIRIKICQMLQKIDEERGRAFTLDLFARDIPGGYSYGTMQYIEEIVPLLTKTVDQKRLFAEEFAYMNRVLREETCCETDQPEIEPDDSGVCEILRDWLWYLADMPVVCVMERAKIMLAYLYDESDVEFIGEVPEDFHSERQLLETGCYLAELQSKRLSDYKEFARKGAVSVNYQYRVYAAKILEALGEEMPKAPHRNLPATYTMVFTNESYKPLSWLPGKRNNPPDVNWMDADSIMSVASHWCGHISRCSGIDKHTINVRAVELMKKFGDSTDKNEAEDHDISRHYDRINLRYSYKKAHVQAAFDGMLAVAAEINDGNALHHPYLDNFFLPRDFWNINIEATKKPLFIQRIADEKAWSEDKNWIDSYKESPRFSEGLPEYDGRVVIGEYTHIKKMADHQPMEEYQAMLSFEYGKREPVTETIFGESPFMRNSSDYLSMGYDDPEIILLRGGYYTDFSNKNRWIAINPALAALLGWRPCSDGYFAWQNSAGEMMVESIFWRSGNINGSSRDHYEASEGWLVVASEKALDEICELAELFVHKKIIRRYESDLLDTSHMAYQVKGYDNNIVK